MKTSCCSSVVTAIERNFVHNQKRIGHPAGRQWSLLISAFTAGVVGLQAQTYSPATATTALPASTPYTVTSRDAHSAIWQQQEYQRRPNGTIVTNIHCYVELATGLNHLVNGKYVPSAENIAISPDGGSAMATNGQHQIYFPGNIYNGVIKLVTPDGTVLRSEPIGLAYSDGSNSVLLAVTTNSTGAVLPSGNQVIYTNAFDGLDADLLYTYTKAGFEQNVILRQQPPDPGALNLNPQTTRLQVLTEFVSSPPPGVTATTVSTAAGNLEDDTLSFGTMAMGLGNAFLLGGNSPSVSVEKRWLTLNGRQFLIEEVPIVSIATAIDSLPPFVGQAGLRAKPVVTKNLVLPPTRVVHASPKTRFLAQATPPTTGLVLDYQMLNSNQTNYTFQGDTTYYISGQVTLYGTNTFEGGAVLKYTNGAAITLNGAIIPSAINCQTGPYRPFIMTAKDDNTVGETVSGSTGNPTNYYANPALGIVKASAQTVSNFRIAYAYQGISASHQTVSFYNGQLVNCQGGVSIFASTVYLRNVLFAGVQTNFNETSASTVDVQNGTFNNVSNLCAETANNALTLNVTNCVLANVTNLFAGAYTSTPNACTNGFYNCPSFGLGLITNTFYPFQSKGAGSYYLTNGCNFFNHGTINIDPVLLTNLQTRTVYPPAYVYTNKTISSANWIPQVQRDTNAAPALGYHYAPIDYAVSGVNVNGTLTLSNGVAVASFQTVGAGWLAPGFTVSSNDWLISVGTVLAHNQICHYAAVQEQPILWGTNAFKYAVPVVVSGAAYMWYTAPAVLYARFTDFNGLAGLGSSAVFEEVGVTGPKIGGGDPMEFNLRDCRVGPGWLACLTYQGTDANICINNLFDRGGIVISDFDGDSPVTVQNNLFHNGYVYFDNEMQTYTWTVENNFFDSSTVNGSSGLYENYNGFWNTTGMTPSGGSDVLLTNFVYAPGPLGNYYQLSTNLLNKGSTTADQLGLYHYTVQTNEVIEGTNTVSIGFHYVTVDQYGNPLDSNTNGIPDYIEDANGDGLVDNGENPWMAPPTITVPPASQTVIQGSNATFSVTVADPPGIVPSCQWWFNSTKLTWATNALLTITNAQNANAGAYYVVASNPGGSTTSSAATLTIVVFSVQIQPTNQIVAGGANPTFTVSISNNFCQGPFVFQWLRNGTNFDTIGLISTVAGGGSGGGSDGLGDGGPATNAILMGPLGVAADGAGNIYICDPDLSGYSPALVRKIDTNGEITVVAGGGTGDLGDGGQATNANLSWPGGITMDGAGKLFIADTYNLRIRKVNTNGIITTVAGNGMSGYSGDGGYAINAKLSYPEDVAVDGAGNLFIADSGNNVIRKVSTNGIITTVAGNGTQSYSGDGGYATNAELSSPMSVAVDGSGNLFIADEYNQRIRKVGINGIISTVAGNGVNYYTGDNGQATNAELSYPESVTIDGTGNLYIADSGNNRIRKVDSNGIITTVAGGGSYSDDLGDGGPATNACLNQPTDCIMDTANSLYIADLYNYRLRKVSGCTDTLSLFNVAANDCGSYQVVVSSSCGSVYSSVATLTVEVPPVIIQQPANVAVTLGSNGVFSVTAAGSLLNYQWWFNGTNLINGATNAALILTNVQTSQIGLYDVVVSNIWGSVTSTAAGLTIRYDQYVAFSGAPVNLTNYTFQSDATYFIDTPVALNGTTIIYGGTVIKFSANGTLNVLGPLICQTGPYRPAMLTSKDDNSAGFPVADSTGNPQIAANGLAYLNFQGWNWNWNSTNNAFYGDTTISYLRFAYADKALANPSGLGPARPVQMPYVGTLHVWDCQFVDCNWGIADWFDADYGVYDLHNILFAECGSAFGGDGWGAYGQTIVSGEQLTSDATNFWDPGSNNVVSVSLTNCIITGGFQFSSSVSLSTNCVAFDSWWDAFESVGAANYYLPLYSQYHNAGTTNVSPQMLAELAQKTTYPPSTWDGANLSDPQNFTPQVTRDTGISPGYMASTNIALDLGYHYDPIDYALSTFNLEGGTSTVTLGTVIAAFASRSENQGATYGLNVDGNAQLICRGLANQLNRIVQYNTVQEQSASDWCETGKGSVVCDFLGGTPSPVLTCRFTDWSVMGCDTPHVMDNSTNCAPIGFKDCQFHGGQLVSTYAAINFTNCLFERTYVNLASTDKNTPKIRNNLFWHGTFNFNPNVTNAVVKDNLFDQTSIPDNSASYLTYQGGYNAFVRGYARLKPTFSTDKLLTSALAYQSWFFGNYYQPGNSLLIHAGSTSATNVGLYHYTVTTNQVVDGTNTVSIGYHYVATDGSGNPLCSAGNGVPDYIADTNGDGSGSWNDYYQGVLPTLTIVFGDAQSGSYNAFLPAPLMVEVSDIYYNPLTNAPITFSVTNGLNQLALTNTSGATLVSNLLVRTDEYGYALIYVFLPPNAPATNVIFVTAQSGNNFGQITSTDTVALVNTPIINPAGGIFTAIQNVSINSGTPGAVVHYTLNGNTPTETDPTLANGHYLFVWQPATVKARAFDDGVMLPSLVQTASFSFAYPLSAGSADTLVLKPNGTILTGGSNGSGQLGDGTTTDRPHLVSVLNLTNAAGIAAGGLHSLAWGADGTAWAWGSDSNGQLGNGSSGGQQSTPGRINILSSVMALSAGYLHSLALESNGIVYAWGNNAYGQLGDNTTTQRTTPVAVSGLSGMAAISAGGWHSLALGTNGVVHSWGTNASGQLGDGTVTQRKTPVTVGGLSNCLAIAAGYVHSLAITSNEFVAAWGDNTYGQIGNGTTANQTTPVTVGGLSNIVAVAAGQYHSLALRSDGTVWSWGNNSHGQLGDGTTTQRTTPVTVSGLSNVIAIAAGWAHSAALTSDGTVLIWGVTNYGLNGVSSSAFSTLPVISDPSTHVDWAPPVITSQPITQEVFAGDSVTFTVGATGNNLTYQWAFNGDPISGANASSYIINNVGANNQGTYSATVANGMASLVSSNAQLSVDPPPLPGDPFLTVVFGKRQDFTFKNGVTYWIYTPVQLYGQTTIEGGAIIKFDYNYMHWFGSSNPPPTLQVFGSLNCKTAPYNPAILTSIDDDASGDILIYTRGPYLGGVVEPYPTGVPYLDLTDTTNTSISNLRISYADQGVATPAGGRLDVWDCQFVTNNSAVVNRSGGDDSFHNVLFAGCGYAVNASNVAFSIQAEQITANVTNFWHSPNSPTSVNLTNSIILGTVGTVSSSQNVFINPDPSPFQVNGAGNYYLAVGSSLHQSGTTNISPRLLTEFQNKTTYAPPMAFPAFTELDGNLTLFPQASRYTNGPTDIGYYYDAVDYTVADMILNGGTIAVEPGTVVASRMDYVPTYQSYTYIGFDLWNNSAFGSLGTPNKPNVFTDVQSVQEQFVWPVMASFVPDYLPGGDSDMGAPPVLNFRFSDFYMNHCGWFGALYGAPAEHFWSGFSAWDSFEWSFDSAVYLSLQDCKVQGGAIDLGWPDNPYFGYGAPMDFVYGSGAVSWINNSFENVAINVEPTYYPYGFDDQGLNVDMTFTAYNNLFKGCDWLQLEPIPASGGNWVFENNLFDKADIWQDPFMPLDYAYNGYWPKTASELLWGWDSAQFQPTTTGDGFNDGQGEVILNSAPPYQCGPFGNFYMPTNTLLYSAGSTNAAGIGAYHYTTRIDQVKEGNEPAGHKVNIGVHYIAATNAPGTSASVPIDTDGDGIPDYVENWHGDGDSGPNRIHTADETDWQNPQTVSGTPDAYNTVYDDIDLSGDGLVGRIKKILGISPLDPSNPLTLTQITTGDEPDNVTFEVPVSYDLLTNAGTLHLLMDGGSGAEFQECDRATDGNCLLKWKTTFDPPGQHCLAAEFTLNGALGTGDSTAPDSTVQGAIGLPTSFSSGNACQFDPLYLEYDSAAGAMLNAQTFPGAAYQIELKDATGSHLKTFTGTADANGQINEVWNLIDDYNNTYVGDSFTAAFNVTPQSGESKTSTAHFHLVSSYVIDGGFTVAYASDNGSLASTAIHYCIEYGVVDPLIQIPESGGPGGFDNHYSSTFNTYTWSGDLEGNPGYLSGVSDATNLENNLGNVFTRNFHFDGHANPYAIGNNLEGSAWVNITTTEIQSVTGNYLDGWMGFQFRGQPYRFVFLNGCETADNDDWHIAFGIYRRITSAELQTKPSDAQAFVGWVHSPRIPYNSDDWLDFTSTYAVLYDAWMSGAALDDCLDRASQPYPYGRGYPPLNWPLGKRFLWKWAYNGSPFHPSWNPENWFQNWFRTPNNFYLKIYGYAGLERSGYDSNPRHDNSKYYGSN